ncbi:hypothetical protein L1987_41012 [Smallanthus sonchifolius]|uniref:Uncharacterized protein n=1 Tax=Smallanthus sonchifolius TaxID=185202 RepID=A0ACB9GUT6_9ASTR|nr:hypothetical protein L1987_41012 [Smallanthus sonchifolius]
MVEGGEAKLNCTFGKNPRAYFTIEWWNWNKLLLRGKVERAMKNTASNIVHQSSIFFIFQPKGVDLKYKEESQQLCESLYAENAIAYDELREIDQHALFQLESVVENIKETMEASSSSKYFR